MASKKNKSDLILKIRSSVICPKCGEKYLFYISKKNKKKGILFGEYFHEGFFDSHYGDVYDCYTCGHHWTVRQSEKSLPVKLFPFLEDK